MEHNCPIHSLEQQYGYPPALAKACCDPFDYAMKLRDGTLIFFDEATAISTEWVTVHGISKITGSFSSTNGRCSFDRGIDIRVSEIIWVADAPNGS